MYVLIGFLVCVVHIKKKKSKQKSVPFLFGKINAFILSCMLYRIIMKTMKKRGIIDWNDSNINVVLILF